jgi:hypothetical protein
MPQNIKFPSTTCLRIFVLVALCRCCDATIKVFSNPTAIILVTTIFGPSSVVLASGDTSIKNRVDGPIVHFEFKRSDCLTGRFADSANGSLFGALERSNKTQCLPGLGVEYSSGADDSSAQVLSEKNASVFIGALSGKQSISIEVWKTSQGDTNTQRDVIVALSQVGSGEATKECYYVPQKKLSFSFVMSEQTIGHSSHYVSKRTNQKKEVFLVPHMIPCTEPKLHITAIFSHFQDRFEYNSAQSETKRWCPSVEIANAAGSTKPPQHLVVTLSPGPTLSQMTIQLFHDGVRRINKVTDVGNKQLEDVVKVRVCFELCGCQPIALTHSFAPPRPLACLWCCRVGTPLII